MMFFLLSQVVSPNIYNSKLWQTSGHWDHYEENMFRFEVEKEKFGLKPMNCPGHCLIFDHGKSERKSSYFFPNYNLCFFRYPVLA